MAKAKSPIIFDTEGGPFNIKKGDSGVFRNIHPIQAEKDFNAILDGFDNKTISSAEAIKQIHAFAKKNPYYIDAPCHIASLLFYNEDYAGALIPALQAYDLGLAALPENYAGRIEWIYLENRPFLRSAHTCLLTLQKIGAPTQALQIMKKMLIWNPDDNMGIRSLLSSDADKHN